MGELHLGFSTSPIHRFNGLGLDFEVGCSWKMVWGSLHMENPHHNMASTCYVCDAGMFSRTYLSNSVFYMLLIGIWNYRYLARYPPHMNTKISYAYNVHPDELGGV